MSKPRQYRLARVFVKVLHGSTSVTDRKYCTPEVGRRSERSSESSIRPVCRKWVYPSECRDCIPFFLSSSPLKTASQYWCERASCFSTGRPVRPEMTRICGACRAFSPAALSVTPPCSKMKPKAVSIAIMPAAQAATNSPLLLPRTALGLIPHASHNFNKLKCKVNERTSSCHAVVFTLRILSPDGVFSNKEILANCCNCSLQARRFF